MSDNKDQKTDKVKITPFTDLSDFDSTIRLDLSSNQNIVSTSSPNEITSDDFDKTIDGLLGMEELLSAENNLDSTDEEITTSLSPDDIDFGELDAGIDALSKDLLEPASGADEFGVDEIKSDENSFDILDEPFNDNDDAEAPSTETDSLLDISDDIELDEEAIEEIPPVIELTEEMLDEPDQPLLPELNDSLDSVDESNNENDGDNRLESIVETPELTTTETNVLADATAAIKEIAEEEKEMATQELAAPPESQTPAEQSNGSNLLPILMGLMGIAAGGFGAWMAFDATNQVADLERQIQNMNPAAKSEQAQKISAIQQRLTKIERRLTGTPTIEAAAPLGSTTSKPEKAMPETKAVVKVITPQTRVIETDAKAGGWVVNLSSHAKESLAKREQVRLQNIGLNAQVHTALVKDRTWYRVQITGFANIDEAKAQLRDIQQKSGIKGAWIGKK